MNSQFLGWGSIGTPAGFQQVSKGVSQVVDFVHHFDLSPEFGLCFPTPSLEAFQHPLFCIFYNAEKKFLGMGHYIGVNASNISRQGNYLGSFLLCTDNHIPKGSGELVLRLLEGFSKVQYQQLVDSNTCSYKQEVSFNDLNLPYPQEIFKQLENNLTEPSAYFKSHSQSNKSLVIYYRNARLPQLLNSIIEQELFMDFSAVYFTSSLILAKKALEQQFMVWSPENFDGAHWEWNNVFKPISNKYIQELNELNQQFQVKLEKQRADDDVRFQQQVRSVEIHYHNLEQEAEQRYQKLKQETREEISLYQKYIEDKNQEIRSLEFQIQQLQSNNSFYSTTSSSSDSVQNDHFEYDDLTVNQGKKEELPSKQELNWKTIVLIAMVLGLICVISFALTMFMLI